jgi:hypothetical protein
MQARQIDWPGRRASGKNTGRAFVQQALAGAHLPAIELNVQAEFGHGLVFVQRRPGLEHRVVGKAATPACKPCCASQNALLPGPHGPTQCLKFALSQRFTLAELLPLKYIKTSCAKIFRHVKSRKFTSIYDRKVNTCKPSAKQIHTRLKCVTLYPEWVRR